MVDRQPKHTLLLNGAVLILLGLLSGFVTPAVTNPRMGLSAHVGGVLNGMLLIVLGLAWPHARLPCRLKRAMTWLLLLSLYGIWGFTLLGAVFGTSQAAPIAGEGFSGERWQEALVTGGLTVAAFAILAGDPGPRLRVCESALRRLNYSDEARRRRRVVA